MLGIVFGSQWNMFLVFVSIFGHIGSLFVMINLFCYFSINIIIFVCLCTVPKLHYCNYLCIISCNYLAN